MQEAPGSGANPLKSPTSIGRCEPRASAFAVPSPVVTLRHYTQISSMPLGSGAAFGQKRSLGPLTPRVSNVRIAVVPRADITVANRTSTNSPAQSRQVSVCLNVARPMAPSVFAIGISVVPSDASELGRSARTGLSSAILFTHESPIMFKVERRCNLRECGGASIDGPRAKVI